MRRSNAKQRKETMAEKEGYDGFGQRVARLRKAAGLTQVQFAQQLGTTQRMVTYWESEGGRPPGHLLPRMAELFGISIDALLGQEQLKESAEVRHSRLWQKLRVIEKLSEADRKAVLRFVEALLAKQKLDARSSARQ